MPESFAVTGLQVLVEVSPGETVLNLFNPIAAPTTRGAVFYFTVGASGTMADQEQRVQLQRTTVVGTEGAGVVPANFDSDGPTGDYDAGEDHSVEPTYTAAAELWEQPVHVRALSQIQLQPDSHFKMPATQNAGVGVRTFSATFAGGAHATIHFSE